LATNITNPDFAKIAKFYGARGFKIEVNDDIPNIMQEAFSINGPSLIEVSTSPEYLVAYTKISDIKNAKE